MGSVQGLRGVPMKNSVRIVLRKSDVAVAAAL